MNTSINPESIDKLQKTCRLLRTDIDEIDVEILELELAKNQLISELEKATKKLTELSNQENSQTKSASV